MLLLFSVPASDALRVRHARLCSVRWPIFGKKKKNPVIFITSINHVCIEENSKLMRVAYLIYSSIEFIVQFRK